MTNFSYPTTHAVANPADDLEAPNLDLFQKEPLTPELVAKHLQAVSAHHGKNEKLAWKRKIKKMQGIIDEVSVFEQKILDLVKDKQPLLDEISLLRIEMVKECIHPKEHLVHVGTYLICKFCDKKISIPRIFKAVEEVEADDDSTDE